MAKKVSAAVKTHACDILDYDCTNPFDVVCTHGFLKQFTPEGRKSVVAKWRHLLRPGGKVVTTERIVPARTKGGVGFRTSRVSEVRKKVVQRAEMWRDFLDIDPEELASQAEPFAERQARRRRRKRRLSSRREIADLFEGGGLAIDRLEVARIHLKARHPTPGLNPPIIVEHAQIVATRV